jgi:uncharacterized protein (DUF433 family)
VSIFDATTTAPSRACAGEPIIIAMAQTRAATASDRTAVTLRSKWLYRPMAALASRRTPASYNVSRENGVAKTMLEHPRITLAPEVLAGKPLIRGTRLSVEFVIGLLADGQSEVDILENYPGITHEDIIVSRLPAASLSDRTSGQMRERNSCTQSIPCAEAS